MMQKESHIQGVLLTIIVLDLIELFDIFVPTKRKEIKYQRTDVFPIFLNSFISCIIMEHKFLIDNFNVY